MWQALRGVLGSMSRHMRNLHSASYELCYLELSQPPLCFWLLRSGSRLSFEKLAGVGPDLVLFRPLQSRSATKGGG
jgi:hypothetical protein